MRQENAGARAVRSSEKTLLLFYGAGGPQTAGCFACSGLCGGEFFGMRDVGWVGIGIGVAILDELEVYEGAIGEIDVAQEASVFIGFADVFFEYHKPILEQFFGII